MMRVVNGNPELPLVERGNALTLVVDGQTVSAFEGETIAAVLLGMGVRTFRHSQKQGAPRGIFCGMGVCHDCLVTVDGIANVRACVTTVHPHMVIETRGTVQP